MAASAHQIVKVTNNGDTEFKDGYANRVYVIPAGGEAFVPGDAANLWFGDASLEGPGRVSELKRLAVKYGVYYDEDLWGERTPKVSVSTLEGDEIPVLAQDRDAGTYSQVDNTSLSVEERMEALQQELRNLQSVMAAQQSSTPADVPADGEDDDDEDEDDDDEGGEVIKSEVATAMSQGNTPSTGAKATTPTPKSPSTPPKDGAPNTPAPKKGN